MLKFIITVDTEEDNSWDSNSNVLLCENWKNISLFQTVCEKHGFLPTYLLTYSMLLNEDFCNYLSKLVVEEKCRLGIHLHTWSTPPFVKGIDDNSAARPIVNDYNYDQLLEKFIELCSLFKKRFNTNPIVCRAGRWCTSDAYFVCLKKIGCLFDCSFTPGLDLSNTKGVSTIGNDYRDVKKTIHTLDSGVIEVPMTTIKMRTLKGSSFKNRIKNVLLKKEYWLRPAVSNLNQMIRITKATERREYIMFMIHSSELLPGVNPYVSNEKQLNYYIDTIDRYFNYLNTIDCVGLSFEELLERNNGN